MYDVLHETLATGALVVTPTRRLARHLILSYDTAQWSAGRLAWQSADVLPWGTWINLLFERAGGRVEACPRLLSTGQERELWREIIRTSNPDVDVRSMERLALDAWRLQHEWRIHPPRAGSGDSVDVDAYAGWSRRFAAQCRRNGWITQAELGDWLASHTRGDPVGRRLVFYAFDRFTPQQQAVLDACSREGNAVSVQAPPLRSASVQHKSYSDCHEEMTAVASRVRALLDSERGARIGIVVPDLAARRGQLKATMDSVFDPAASLILDGQACVPYNVSLGAPLRSWPAVHTLMLMLRFSVQELTVAQVAELLASPYLIAGQREFNDRALFDAHLRERGGLTLGAEAFVQLLLEYHADTGRCAVLASTMSHFLSVSRGLRGKRLPSQWLDVFHGISDVVGWPGERTLDSTEMQVVERCRSTMSELATYDLVSDPLEARTAIDMLARVFAETIFQPESPDVPVQVLGVLESAGIEFDHLFVMGLSDQTWPAASHPNALLPLATQRALGVPHASFEWERDFSRRMMDLWASTASSVEYSSVRWRDDQSLRPSALLHGLPRTTYDGASESARICSFPGALFAVRRWETIPEAAVPMPASGSPIRGGAAVLKDQSTCPFRAFAVHRLGARELEAARIGLDGRDRGVLIHSVLEAYARQVSSSHQLQSLSEKEISNRIDIAVREGLSSLMKRRGHLMPEAFLVTEAARVRSMLEAFVHLERNRMPFKVRSRETAGIIHLNGLTLVGRPDRVDEIETGDGAVKLVVIDYKTGRVSARDWFGPRPAEPQLPLYALAQSSPVAAIAFVNLRADRVAWTGVGAGDDLIEGVSSPRARVAGDPLLQDWDAVLGQWDLVLATLAGEFAAGVAAVDPREGRKSCRNCRLETLCRVDLRQSTEEENVDGSES